MLLNFGTSFGQKYPAANITRRAAIRLARVNLRHVHTTKLARHLDDDRERFLNVSFFLFSPFVIGDQATRGIVMILRRIVALGMLASTLPLLASARTAKRRGIAFYEPDGVL